MISKIGISFLFCVALTAATPFSPLKQSNIPSDADFDIIVVTIEGPDSSESSEDAFHDALFNRFFNFQFPEFPGLKRIFSSEEIFDDKTSEKRAALSEIEAENVSTEVADKAGVAAVTISPIEAQVIADNAPTFIHPAQNAPFDFGIANVLNNIMNSVLSGFIQTLQNYQFVPANSSEISKIEVEVEEPELAQILADKPEMNNNDISEMEKKIEQLFLENDSSENDLKHGGAMKAPKPKNYRHEFHSARKARNSDEDSKERKLRGAVFPSFEKSGHQENYDLVNNLKGKNEVLDLSSDEQADLEFDRKILEILATFEDEIRKNQALETLAEKETLKEKVMKDVSSLSPEEKTEGNVVNQSKEIATAMSANISPRTMNRIVRGNMDIEPIAGASEPSLQENDSSEYYSDFDSYKFMPRMEQTHYDLPNFLSSEMVLVPISAVPKSSKNFNPFGNYGHPEMDAGYYMPQEIDTSEFYGFPQVERAGHNSPDLSDVILVAQIPQSPMNLAPHYGHYGHPIMAAYPHPYAPYLWAQPQMPAAGIHAARPFDFLGQHLMSPHYFFM